MLQQQNKQILTLVTMHALFAMIMCYLFMYALSVRYVPYFTSLNLPYLIQNVARNVVLYYPKKKHSILLSARHVYVRTFPDKQAYRYVRYTHKLYHALSNVLGYTLLSSLCWILIFK